MLRLLAHRRGQKMILTETEKRDLELILSTIPLALERLEKEQTEVQQ